jgi:hypothetical protein
MTGWADGIPKVDLTSLMMVAGGRKDFNIGVCTDRFLDWKYIYQGAKIGFPTFFPNALTMYQKNLE